MHIRPKTKRRLLILFAVAGGALGLLAIVFAFSRHRNTVALRGLRHDAIAAYNAGDYEKSVKLLQEYIDKAPDSDPDVQFAFAESRIKVPMTGGKQYFEGINAFKTYLDSMKPGDEKAQHELLKLYVQASDNVEAEHLADEILAKSPRNADALWWKVWALVGEHRPEDALKTCLKLNEIEPLNLNAQLETIDLMAKTSAPADKAIANAMALHNAHENDPRFEVLLAAAYAQAKQDDEKKKWLLAAALQTPPDEQFVVAMVSSLDNAGLYAEADDFLKRAADAVADPLVQRLFAQRLWQDGKLADLQSRWKNLDAGSRTADGMLLGYRALALYADGKKQEAAALTDVMSHRSDIESAAWVTALSAEYATTPLSPSERVAKFQQAVIRDPQNPVLRIMLARAYLQTGEAELVIPQCEPAIQFARSWSVPYAVAAQALLTSGRNGEAVNTAREAWRRAAGDYETETTLAQADFALANETGLAGDYARMLPHLERIQQAWHDPQTLPIYVAALARAGKGEQAAGVIKDALAATPPLAAPVLTNLAEVAASEHVEAGNDILDFARKAHGVTPEIAYAQADALLHDGKQSQAAQLLADAEKGHERELPWRIVLADFHEVTDSPDAINEWISLGDENPSDLRLQQTILRAQSRTKDRAFWARTIDRLQKLAGEQSLLWRIERGRWLLSGDLTDKDKAEAVNILTEVTAVAPRLAEPHRLLAIAMQKGPQPNIPGAITELTIAADASPADPAITRALVELLLTNGRTRDAMAYLDKLAQKPRLGDDAREWLVHMFVLQGANEKALSLLADDKNTAADPVRHDLLLAKLYRGVGHGDQARKLYLSLLDKPINDPAACADAADFFAASQDMPHAEAFLTKLSGLELKPGELEVDRAEFAERWIGVEEAFKQFQGAIQAAPKSAAVWNRLANFHMRHERFNDAAAAAESGLKSVPDSAPLKALRSAALTLASLDGAADVQPLVDAFGQNAQDPAATEMLGVIASAHATKLSASDSAKRIRAVADKFPDSIPLQSQAIRGYLAANETDTALGLAQRAASAFPNSPEPQRLLSQIYVAMGAWGKAEQSALLWREHSMGRPMGADIALAEIYLREPKRDPAGAVRVLEPHISSAAPLQNPLATELYAKALVLVGRSHDAAGLLKPLAADAPHWRRVWLDLATSQSDAAAASDWLSQVQGLIPADAQKERVELANAWYKVGEQFDSSAAIDNARQTVVALLTSGESSLRIWTLSARISLAQADYAAAEKAYRAALKLDPQSADAMNDLAYVLWVGGKDENLAEAQKLAEGAIAARPADAGFFDTLARIQARAGNREGAIANFSAALQKDSSSLEAMIGLADLLSRDVATRDRAKGLLGQIQRQLQTSPPLSSVLRKQYQNARDAVASSL